MNHILGTVGFIILSALLSPLLSGFATQKITLDNQIGRVHADLQEGYSTDHFTIGEGPYLYLITKQMCFWLNFCPQINSFLERSWVNLHWRVTPFISTKRQTASLLVIYHSQQS